MCGIVGFVGLGPSGHGVFPSARVLDCMTDVLAHRGPNSRGTWYDEQRGVGLGHRRLAIRDLSSSGAQPMTSNCGRYIIVYNGEVYSHEEIALDLASRNRKLRGHSDTEVILEACAEWGVDRVVPRLIGMFAFALYDKETGELVLVRDRLGKKPIYWAAIDGYLMFGSELKALRQVPSWTPRLDRNALAVFMRHNYIPGPHTIYQGVCKLEPGTMLKVGREGALRVVRFWDLVTIAERSVNALIDIGDDEAIEHLDKLVSDAVQRRLVADVPIGTLLSGGINSSVITAIMAECAGRKIHSFSIGFDETGFDEAPFARAVARHIGTDHAELYAQESDAISLVEHLPHWYDEPFADSSQLPTALVCQLARKKVTVVLSGDGGDELFAGYPHCQYALDIWGKMSRIPKPVRRIAAKSLMLTSPKFLDFVGVFLPERYRKTGLGSKLRRLAFVVEENNPEAIYRGVLSQWDESDEIVVGGQEYKGILWENHRLKMPNFLDRMMLIDLVTYLPDDILAKVDRASMLVGLEVRAPLLDHRLVEYAWSLPQRFKLRDGVSKWALRQLLLRRVPRQLIDRPKMGFGLPLGTWLRGPLRDWAESLLNEQRLTRDGIFRAAPIRERWQAHLRGGADWSSSLWGVLMAQAWLEANPEVKF